MDLGRIDADAGLVVVLALIVVGAELRRCLSQDPTRVASALKSGSVLGFG